MKTNVHAILEIVVRYKILIYYNFTDSEIILRKKLVRHFSQVTHTCLSNLGAHGIHTYTHTHTCHNICVFICVCIPIISTHSLIFLERSRGVFKTFVKRSSFLTSFFTNNHEKSQIITMSIKEGRGHFILY